MTPHESGCIAEVDDLGCPQSCIELAKKKISRIRSLRFCQNADKEDFLSDTVLQLLLQAQAEGCALQELPSFEIDRCIDVVRSALKRRWRRESRKASWSAAYEGMASPTVFDEVEFDDMCTEVAKDVKLTSRENEIYQLHFVKQLPLREIAERMSLPESVVRRAKYSLVDKLRRVPHLLRRLF